MVAYPAYLIGLIMFTIILYICLALKDFLSQAVVSDTRLQYEISRSC